MAIFDRFRRTPIQESGTDERQLLQMNAALNDTNINLQESMRELILYMEDFDWIPVEGYKEDVGFPLDIIKTNADKSRALLAANPIIKKAINARISYIWGNDLEFQGGNVKRIIADPNNQRTMFGYTARDELEKTLATDGNIFVLRDNKSNQLDLIPLNEITGYVSDPKFKTKVTYILHEWDEEVMNFATGIPKITHQKYFYPTDYAVNPVSRIDDIPVDKTQTIIHGAVNRQAGWVWGIGDITAAMFWTKAHKELFEDGKTYVKAQGRFASKVIAKTQAGAANAAATVATQPRRDPETGAPLDIGGTAVMGGGLDMQLMGKMNGGVDFGAFEPVLALVAAGLDIPVSVLTAAPTDEFSLEQSTVLIMAGRQRFWGDLFKAAIGTPANNMSVVWPPIATEPTHRQVASIEIINNTGTLHRSELRQLTLQTFGLKGDPNDLPPISENPQIYIPIAIAQQAQGAAAKAADKATQAAADAADSAVSTDPAVGDQGVNGKVGKQSAGDHELRDEGTQQHTSKNGKQ